MTVPSWFDRLRCPQCGGPLVVTKPVTTQQGSDAVDDVPDGMASLSCPSCPQTFPIVGGIPRFVAQEHLASFGHQWNTYEVAHADEDRATFEAKTGVRLDELAGLRVLDAGCGGGRYSRIAAEAGADVMGADHSSAVEKAARLCEGLANVGFVQADLKKLPLEPGSFDLVFSIGVMHHDADTRAVFDAVAKMVKPGGRLVVWLYRKNQWWQELLNTAVRKRTVRCPADRLERWCGFGAWLGGIPVVRQTLNKVLNFSNHPDRENRLCDTFDWYAPLYQHHHTVEEVCRWFDAAGYEDLKVLPPEKTGRLYRWSYEHNLLIGSGVNVQGRMRPSRSIAPDA